MKKIIIAILFVVSLSTNAQTVQQVKDLIDLNLASNTNISAETLRGVQYALADFTQTALPLAKGSFVVGDHDAIDKLYLINIPNVGTSDYYIVGSIRSNSANYDNDNDILWVWREPNPTSFKIALREVSKNVQNITFYWQIFKN